MKPITSSEIAALWTSYIQNSLSTCVLQYFLTMVEDPDVTPFLENMYQLTSSNTTTIKDLFANEGIPAPLGFTEEDVNPNAGRLFDDTFFLTYLYRMTKVGMISYSIFQSMSVRSDIEKFFSLSLKQLSDMHNGCTEMMLAKGILIRPPYIPIQETAEFVESNRYFKGYSIFGENRPLNAIEIAHLHENIQTNLLGMMLCNGFSQVARSQLVRDNLYRGAEIAKKHIEIFSKLLLDSNVQAPMTWDNQSLVSKTAPFSDKLMMYHIHLLIASGIGNYATSAAASLRRDITATYGRLSLEVAQYAQDGAKLMVDKGWLEEPPQMVDRKALKNRG
ncbi:MAG TPA: DUF3231 family protein [Bacillales bacterium]|nr:DUF3231 family protein [Bacillales bacterium]